MKGLLKFITGGVNSKRSVMLTNDIAESVREGRDVLVIVPDQYSFEFNNELYERLGARAFNSIRTCALNNLCEETVKRYGFVSGDFADKNVRLILMFKALSNVRKNVGLSFYKKAADKPDFCSELLGTFDDLRYYGITEADLKKARDAEDGLLADKLDDIITLYSEYKSTLDEKGLKDSTTLVDEAREAAARAELFRGKDVFFHEFSDFSHDEFKLITLILSQAQDVTVSLIMTDEENSKGAFSPYKTVSRTKSKLRSAAASMGIEVKEEHTDEYLYKPGSALEYLSKTVLSVSPKPFEGDCDGVEAVTAGSPYEEAEYVAAKITELVKGGMRYSDIAVFTRNIKEYYPIIESAFERYDIPIFADVHQSVSTSSLAAYIMNIFDCVLTREPRTDNILRYIKSPLSYISLEEISMLEEYVLKWGVDRKLWLEDFFGKTDETDEELLKINSIRRRAVEPLSKFKADSKGVTADVICLNLNELLTKIRLSENTFDIIKRSMDNDDKTFAEQARLFKQVWKSFLAAVNSIYTNLKGEKITLKSFAALLRVLLLKTTVSNPPQYLDTVTVARAEHSRVSEVKASFVMGLNDGVFPYVGAKSSLITSRERQRLTRHGVGFPQIDESTLDSERLITLIALLSGKSFLCASRPASDSEGNPLRPSEAALSVEAVLPAAKVSASDMPAAFYCQTPKSAYFKYLDYYVSDKGRAREVRSALEKSGEYSEKLSYFDKLCEGAGHKLSPDVAKKLFFSRSINLSATRAEDYYKCPFGYFCKNGLRIYPSEKLDISPSVRGSLIHFCLEELMCKKTPDGAVYDVSFEALTDKEIREKIHRLCESFSNEALGGSFAKPERFKAQLLMLEGTVFYVVKNILEELRGSLFRPCAFEYDLTRSNGESLLKIKVRDGVYINVRGKIDRVDFYDDGDVRYIRVTDYKTGGKKLSLAELYHGLNMQMLIYLLAVTKTENELSGGKPTAPAGILYMPAKSIERCVDRDKISGVSEDELESTLKDFYDKQFKRDGLLVDNEISIRAMDEALSGLYAPVRLNKDGSYRKSDNMPMSRLAFDALEDFVAGKLTAIGNSLLDGKIEAKPIKKANEMSCKWCEYWSVCGNYGDKDPRVVEAEDSDRLLSELEKAVNGGDENA